MKYQERLTLKSDKPIKPELLKGLGRYLQQQSIEVFFFDADWYCLEKCKELIVEKGPTYILSLAEFREAALPKAIDSDTRELLVKILCNHLQALSPSKGLIIVDPYIFPANLRDKADYLDVFKEIFGSVIPQIASLRFITKPDYDEALYQSITQLLVGFNPQISVSCRTTNDFHDRFWIADEKKGLFVGTSLNGIGKKYALTDFMKDEDTAVIMEEIRRLHLL